MTELRQVLDRWRQLDVTVRDLPLALLLAVVSFVPAFHGLGTDIGKLPDRPFDALAVVAIVLQCFPLAVRRRWPAAVLVVVFLGFALDQLQGYHTLAGTGLAIALLSAGAYLERRRRTVTVLLSGAYVVLAVALHLAGGTERVDGYVTFYLALILVWAVGSWLRSTRAAEADRRLRVAEETRTAERTRIARELHDVVTHHVTAMVVQTEAARYLTAAPDRLDETLNAVTDTGRRAIGDLRHLLDLLDPGHDTAAQTPSLRELHTLVEQTRRAGQPVELTEEGTPSESAGSAELVAHRVVQEALTNALKHAHGSPTAVGVRYDDREITVEVSTAGASPQPAGVRQRPAAGTGRGLVGLRERVDALGGEFGADRRADGGFVVHARIPTGSPA
ncbi:Signal transduction histidine kinase [Promicromonospora umidemergens]|uniref:sensor histidine kinase n=1 Tax=Promicromonospora umidemergens TaxID=629679 RepID=UPI0020A250AF|nr:histidine kinase [Promicromonospora umidemergens]MCP2282436.1 Signal transduction histidine kinase [Promicromonospora umidemergens]